MKKQQLSLCASLLNDMSLAFYHNDTKLMKSTEFRIMLYEVMYGISDCFKEVSSLVNYYSNL